MLVLILAVVLWSTTVVLAQDDNYGFPESALLDPTATFGRLTLTPTNFQALLGNPDFSSVATSSGSIASSPNRVRFVESENVASVTDRADGNLALQFEQALPQSNRARQEIFIEDFSAIPTTFRPSNSQFTNGSPGQSNTQFSPVTSSTFTLAQPQGTPATPTNIPRSNPRFSNNNRITSNSLGQSFSRQTSNRGNQQAFGGQTSRDNQQAFGGQTSRDNQQSFGRQSSRDNSQSVQGGVDFSQATRTEDGRLCVIKEESVETLSKDPILQCTHKQMEKCHYTYITYFKPAQEEVCEENFEKKCQITFKQEAMTETVRKCYRPQEKVCNGQGPEECRTVYESSCTTKYIEKTPGKFVGDTACEKLPVKICGRGCVLEEGPEECHEKQIDSLVDIPEEVCDLNPQKTCRLQTKLVPSLKPKQECTIVPQETCTLNFSQPKRERKPLRTEWCLDEGGVGTSQAVPSSIPAAPLPLPQTYSRNQKSTFL
jgi:hypothetical protein